MTYVCADGTCLKKPNPECDSVTDCPDASDEKQCGETINTPAYRFTSVQLQVYFVFMFTLF